MPNFKSFDGTEINYQYYEGKLPQVLFFLHGWSAKGEYYYFLKEYLKDFHLFFWDARSHGESETKQSATIGDLADDFKFFLDHVYKLGYPVTAVGHSMGALTLFEYIGKYGTNPLSKVVIVDQSPKLITDEDWKLGIYGNYTEEMNREMVTHFKKDVGEGVIYLNSKGLNENYRKLYQKHPDVLFQKKRMFTPEANIGLVSIWETLVKADYRPVLQKIDIPALLLYGLKSQYYLKETGEYVKNNLKTKKSKLVYLKKGDHSPFVAHPKEFCKEIHDFVLEVS